MSKDIKTPWGEIGYITFKRTYARRLKEEDPNSKTEEFWQVVQRELDASEKQLGVKFTEEEKKRYFETRMQLKWSTAGRFMWQLGTKTVDRLGLPSLQNCFTPDTEFVTSKGIKKFSDFKDGEPVIIKGNLDWREATVKKFGVSETVTLTVTRGKHTKEINTTLNHRWNVGNSFGKKQSIKTTAELEPGMILQHTAKRTNLHVLQMCNIGVQHGLVFGDGHYSENAKCCSFVPCGDSSDEYRKFFYNGFNDRKEITGLPNTWKELPSFDMNKHYIYGFLAGLFAADGSVGKTGTLTLSNKSKDVLNYVRGLFAKLDIYCGEINLSREINPFDGTPAELYRMTIYRDNLNENFLLLTKHKQRWSEYNSDQHWKVVSVSKPNGYSDVWCVVEPDKEEFTLANGILTKNCAFTVVNEPVRPFTWAFEMLMLGSGVGYNIQKHNVYQLPKVKNKIKIERKDTNDADFVVPDSREGWVKLLAKVLKAHFYSGESFTYSTVCIRSKGALIKGFGGTASGPEDLCHGIAEISKLLNSRSNKKLRPIDCLDIMNIIGSVVVAGNVRRSAQIAIGDYDDIEFIKAKRWDLGTIPNWRSMSNNSIVAPTNIDDLPKEFWDTYEQGEPYGLINLELSRTVGRTGETQYPDPNVEGFNPCAEQSLEDKETCCLAEVYLPNVTSYEELLEVLTYAYRVNKHSLALHCSLKETEAIVNKNMRMGIGMTGVLQATEEQRSWLKGAYVWLREYDVKYSQDHNFPISIKLTTVKPSGTLSLLAGVTPGVHPNPAGPHYIRRVRMSSQSPLIEVCRTHGYGIEYQMNFDGSLDKSTMVVSFPCKLPETTPVAADYSWKQQLDMVRRMQEEWSDNSVSCTVYYKKEDLEDIKSYLKEHFRYSMKTVSFLLYQGHGFVQAPYETITEEQYKELTVNTIPITTAEVREEEFMVDDCASGHCPIK